MLVLLIASRINDPKFLWSRSSRQWSNTTRWNSPSRLLAEKWRMPAAAILVVVPSPMGIRLIPICSIRSTPTRHLWFQRFAANVPMAELLRDLETKDVRNAKGNCYTRKTLTKLLSNRIYIGEYRYTDIVIPGGVPAIMDKEVFDAVAARLANSNCR